LVLSLSLLLTCFESQIFEAYYVHNNPITALQLNKASIWPYTYVSLYNPWGFRCFEMLCSIVAQVVLDISKENCVFIFTGQSVPDTPLWQHLILYIYILGKFQICYKLKCIYASFIMLLFFLHLFITQGLPEFWHPIWSYSY
jgi:hypothetical protein